MKSSNSPLEKKRPLLFAAGLMFAVSITLVSFEWRTPYKVPYIPEDIGGTGELPYELPDITTRDDEDEIKKPEPPKLEVKTDQIEIVEKDIVDNDEPDEPFIPEVMDDLPKGDGDAPEPDADEPDFFTIVEDMPSYPGGDPALLKYIGEHVVYPALAIENNITGAVWVSYIVGKNGKVRDVELVRGVHPSLDKEALRVVKSIDGYTAGMQRGKAVPVKFTIPIRFELK
ncbi:MAG: TonB family protein [Flavobacteriales bacterium]|nr:TonB family protein [Flavobacteriales bacterium]